MFEGYLSLLLTPITYRGYMYDPYTGLYYLQSRYYNPTYGRFLNADSTDILEATQGTTHGANLFAYCNNNPVNYVDYTGEFSALLIGGGAIAFLTFLKSLVESVLLVLILLMVVIIVVDPALWERISNATIKIGDEIKTGINGLIEMIVHIYRLVESDLCTVIDDIIFRAKNNPYDPKQQKHHIAPQKITFTGQLCSYYVVEKSNININDPINTIMLDASFHRALNTNLYYSLIYNSTKYAFEMSGSEGVWFTLAFYNGLLAVLNAYCGEVW